MRLNSAVPAPTGAAVRRWAALGLVPALAGCLVVAAGAGAGGGAYYAQRGAEATVEAGFERVLAASQQALAERGVRVRQTKDKHDQDGAKREARLEGEARDRNLNVEVRLRQAGRAAVQVQVVAKRTEVTWDKDFARGVLERIVALSR